MPYSKKTTNLAVIIISLLSELKIVPGSRELVKIPALIQTKVVEQAIALELVSYVNYAFLFSM